ncbi:MAG TPA: PAS domain S-box protein [Nitrospirota bacterium]|nr:PAS domain S-box protein [Nitrospirota bacterium]
MSEESEPLQQVQAAMVREQVQLAMRHLPTMQVASFLVALVLARAVYKLVPARNIAVWIAMISLIAASRIVYYYRFAGVRGREFDGEYWKKGYVGLALLSGILWGISAFIIFPAGDYGLISLFVLVIASLSAATTVSHSSLRLGPAAWMTPALLLYAVRCFLESGQVNYTIGLLIVIYYFTLLSYSFYHHKTITSSIALRFENLKLLDEVRRSEERFRLLFQRHNAVMLLIDPQSGSIVDANAAAERFYGFPVERLKSMPVQDINIAPSTTVQSQLMQALRGDCSFFVVAHRLSNGEIRTVEVHSSPIHTEGRSLLFAIIHDVTERNRAEERLRESEAGYRNLFNSMTDAVFIMDETGRFVDVNKGAENVFGHPRDFFINSRAEHLAAPEMNTLAQLNAAIRRAFSTGEPQLVEFWGARADGMTIPQEVRLTPATYRGRRIIIAAARDISERKRSEAEMLRTQKLEVIGVLAGGIAHDFNNLLQGVLGFLAVAMRKIDNRERVRLMLEKSEKAILQSVNLTSQLFTFAKGGKPVKKHIAIDTVVRSAARFALSGSRSLCRFSLDGDLWPVDADENQIGQVIQNIVMNADQAMPGGGVVTVSARNVDLSDAPETGVPGPGRWVEVRIRDTGAGIPGERLPRIFEPYFTTKDSGSGLGLATAYSIMKNHGGMIEVSSFVNKGSEFTVWLPASRQLENVNGLEQPLADLPRRRILVMDDEEVVLDAVGEMLKSLGQEVVFAHDGAAAVELYRGALEAGEPFAVVILDVTVRGGMGGQEAIERLKEIDPHVAAVVSSGYSHDAVVSNYAAYGFRALLRKPFTMKNLQTVLAALIQEI